MTTYPPITVRQPQLYDLVDDPVVVSGVGTGFEGTLVVRVRDALGNQLHRAPIHAGGTGIWGNFSAAVPLGGVPPTAQGSIEVFEVSARDGSEINKVSFVIIFGRALVEPYHGFGQHTVAPGDTLSGIAMQYYGDPEMWHQLFQANGHVLLDPDRIFPGQVLRIPH